MKIFQASFLFMAIVVVSTFAEKSDDEAWDEYKVYYFNERYLTSVLLMRFISIETTRKEPQRCQG